LKEERSGHAATRGELQAVTIELNKLKEKSKDTETALKGYHLTTTTETYFEA